MAPGDRHPAVPWSSQARGFYTGLYTRDMRDNPDRWLPSGETKTGQSVGRVGKRFRAQDAEALRDGRELRAAGCAQTLGTKKGGYTAVEVALAWLLHKPFPVVPVVGPRTPAEFASCLKAATLPLTQDELRWLNLEH